MSGCSPGQLRVDIDALQRVINALVTEMVARGFWSPNKARRVIEIAEGRGVDPPE